VPEFDPKLLCVSSGILKVPYIGLEIFQRDNIQDRKRGLEPIPLLK
jgi:hypothetical protein